MGLFTTGDAFVVPVVWNPEFLFQAIAGSKEEARKKILGFERVVQAMADEFGCVELGITHHYTDDVYVRECLIPKGTILTGRVHNYPCINLILSGKASIFSELGPRLLEAGMIFKSGSGAKRCVFAHEDTVWCTVHPRPKTDDPEEFIERLSCRSYEEFEAMAEREVAALSGGNP